MNIVDLHIMNGLKNLLLPMTKKERLLFLVHYAEACQKKKAAEEIRRILAEAKQETVDGDTSTTEERGARLAAGA